ncbi:MAG: C39 family peptidase [Pirellulaceae bacterium]
MTQTTSQEMQTSAIETAVALGKDGLFLDALAVLQRQGSLRDWSAAHRCEVSWIVRELGAPRLCRWHILKAYREAPELFAVRSCYAQQIADDNGPLDALEFIEASPQPTADEDPEERMKWQWLQASAFIQLRDFAAAGQCIDRMESVGQRLDLVHFARAVWLERQDDVAGALELADKAVLLRESRGSILYKSHLLIDTGQDEAAYALLRDFDERKQVATLSWMMSAIAYERRDYVECMRLLERFEQLSPLRERGFGQQFAMFRCELARRLGDDAKAIEYAQQAKSELGNKFAQRLADPERLSRVDKILPVEFVRQHTMTCGPATLSAISRYWNQPAEHLEVAEEICYNGTTNYAERNWANQNGYTTREFTVDEASTEALIGRDVPFTLVTRGAGLAHLQAVIGYDGRTGSILVRDPSHRVRGTIGADELFESQAAHGPRGMVLVPADRAHLVSDLDLPDAEIYDLTHAFDEALIQHCRDDAIKHLEKIAKHAPKHRLHWQTRRQLAIYDGDEQGILAAVQELLALYPDDVSFQMSELSLLRDLGRTSEQINRLRELVDQPVPHPLFQLQLAELLSLDGRSRDEAQEILRKAIRNGSTYARCYLELADLLWNRQERQRALRLYRFAACLEDKDEFLAGRYFDAAVVLGRIDEALEWLRGRFERFGRQSMQPAMTLYHALTRLRRHAEGIEVLNQALELRPDDSELALAVAQSLATTSSAYWPRAEELLAAVRNQASERRWKEAASQLAVVQGDWKKGLQCLQDLLPRSPLSMSLRERIAELNQEVHGEENTIAFWRSSAEEFPHYQPLVERYAIALRSRPLEEVEPVLKSILESNPENAWAVRELAQHLLSAGKLDQAQSMIDRCLELDSENFFAKILQASLDARRGDKASARARLRELLEHDISDEFAVSRLMDYCDTPDERTEALAWILAELRRQPITGDVLMVYRDYAEAILPEDQVLEAMQEAVKHRSELWPAHRALIRQLTQMQRLDEASQAAEKATQLFPLDPNSWYEQYQVAAAQGDHPLQFSALEQCRLLRPNSATVTRALSDLLCSAGRYDEARDMLQALVAAQPLDAVNRGYLGDTLVELDQKEAALNEFSAAVSLEPEYDYAWNRFRDLANELERPDDALQLTTRLIAEKPHAAAVWLMHARVLLSSERFDEAHQAIDQAEAIEPYREQVYTYRAHAFASAGDFESALQALQPEIYPVVPPALESTRAQLMWDIGEQDAAYALIKKSAEQHPDAIGTWNRLEQWAMLRDDSETATRAVEHQVKLQPHNPDVLDAAGETFLSLDNKPKAIEVYRRAVEIAPTYGGSRCKLFDLLVEQDQWDEASQVIRELPRLDQHPSVLARRMQVALHQKDVEQADADLIGILNSEDWSQWAIERAAELMQEANLQKKFIERIEQRLTDQQSNENIARVWVKYQMENASVSLEERISLVTEHIRRWIGGEHPGAGRAAVSTLLYILSTDDRPDRLQRFVDENESILRENPNNWSTVAFAYADNPSRYKHATMRNWIKDWEAREDLLPWMYTNVHEICRIVGDQAGGRRAVQLALEMPADHMQSQFRLWAAHDALVDGDSQLALRHFMAASRLEHLEGLEKLMHHCIEAVLRMQQSTEKATTFQFVRQQIDGLELKPKFFVKQPVYRPVYENTIKLVAQQANTLAARWWKSTKLLALKCHWLFAE